ncbi:glutathione peroxidase [Desertibacillus haloalkaliphilus]|uniref:glutathione peroxidase n=1 Tax=Desertibacillus haloalkaliphilus TaxID=1328930 RepID=UPI001C275CF3|nr:glutathione peroxidase [Desertibacillus haloalkaliphilus]MBU8907903.1 glutathione peroxidase [Desertibacillus haloalkaliphilus]
MTIYDIEVEKATGEKMPLSTYKGKVLLIVNTASKCTFTPQFDDLQKLYDKFNNNNFEILGFPCNQFGEQEPGTNQEAQAFCQLNYGVKFPVFGKIAVNGEEQAPLFQYLKREAGFEGFDDSNSSAKLMRMMISERNPEWLTGDAIKWNFTKFLVNEHGQVIKRYEPYEEPIDFATDIEQLLRS